MSFTLFSRVITAIRTPSYMVLSNTSSPLSTLSNVPQGATAGGAWSLISTRTNIRNKFPRAKENKRIKINGWLTRLSTSGGRRVLMRRILKGKHVLSH